MDDELRFTLLENGDSLEIKYYDLFIREKIPSYEIFWAKFVVPLTSRPKSIHFKSDQELALINKSASDLCIAQLSYSMLKHLARCFDILGTLEIPELRLSDQFDLTQEGFARLVGAQDNIFELLQRVETPESYKAFDDKDGEDARKSWKIKKGFPLQDIRDYRNSLLHGRHLPAVIDEGRLCLPAINKTNSYLDWRLITSMSPQREEYKKDFIWVFKIFDEAWNETVDYIEKNIMEISR